MTDLDPAHVAWSRDHFHRMRDGGTWGVPRSGVVFTKHGARLELTVCMPHDPAMPLSAQQLWEQQQAEFNNIKRHFEAAGITVVDATKE